MKTICQLAILVLLAFSPIKFALAQSNQSSDQDSEGWEKKIIGTWQVDRKATAEIWNKTYLGKYASDVLYMAPIVPENFIFKPDATVDLGPLVDELGKDSHPRLKNLAFDKQQKRLTITLSNDFGDTDLTFEVVGGNELILQVPAFMAGPARVAYRRTVVTKDDISRQDLAKAAGRWNLDRQLTEKWYEAHLDENLRECQKTRIKLLENEVSNITIGNGRILFANQTSELLRSIPWVNAPDDTMRFTDQLRDSITFEIVRMDEHVIKYADMRRKFVGIYVSDKLDDPTLLPEDLFAGHKQSDVSKTFANIYEKTVQPPLKDRVENKFSDGKVEIEEIEIDRRYSSQAVKGADITNMVVHLFFDTGFNNRVCDGQRLRITKIDPVVDDTGKSLLTTDRKDSNGIFERFVDARTFTHRRNGADGIVHSLTLDAPERAAMKISSFSGEAIIKGYTRRHIEIRDLRSLLGKPIEHPMLKDLEIVPEIVEDPSQRVSLKLKGDEARLITWCIVDSSDGELVYSSFEHGLHEVARSYGAPIPEKINLWLTIANDESETKYNFNFKDVDFP